MTSPSAPSAELLKETCTEPALPTCITRLKNEVKNFYIDPLPGICIVVDEKDIRSVDALVTGPMETPYEGGFFHFKLRFPYDYPNNPPKVALMTTDGGRVRFNPNLYANGKVCLSILNTWQGPSWSPAQSISSVLLSIQSIMNSRPYCNEPGYEQPKDPRSVESYNECVLHETIRVAFCDLLDDTMSSRNLPEEFRALIKDVGPSFFDQHTETCQKRLGSDGHKMIDPFGEDRGTFQWKTLLTRVAKLHDIYGVKEDDADDDEEE